MVIKGRKAIKGYEVLREHFVDLWYQMNFDSGTTYHDIVGNYVKIIDYTGDSIKVPLSEIPGYRWPLRIYLDCRPQETKQSLAQVSSPLAPVQ